MNKVLLIGNLTADPTLKETTSGTAVCTFDIAVNRPRPNADGEKVSDFFRVTTWGTLAENCDAYLLKGNKVCVCGSLQNNTYTDKNGDKRVSTFINAQEVEFLTPKKREDDEDFSGCVVADRTKTGKPKKAELEEVDDDQLPF